MTGTSGFVSSVILNACIAVVVLSIFSLYRRHYDWIYQPRFHPKYRNHQPAPPFLGSGIIDWIRTTLNTDDQTFIKTSGLDAMMLVRCYALGAKLFGMFTILGVGLLVPLNTTGDNGVDGFEAMSLSNVQIGSSRYWAHLIVAYCFTFYTFYELLNFWKQYQSDRYAYLVHEHLHHRRLSLLVHNIPQTYRSDAGLNQIFSRFFPKTISHTYMAKDFTKLNELLKKRDEHIAALEHAFAQKAELEHSNKPPEEKRPKVALTLFCFNKVDAIEHHTSELEKVNAQIAELQKKDASILQSGFVSVNNVVALTSILRQQKTQDAFEFETKLAPEPRDVYWPSLNLTQYERFVRTVIIDVALFFLVFFWSIPVAFVQSLATLQTIAENVFFLSWVTSLPASVTGIIEGILPSLVLTIFMILLPIILKQMTIVEGVESNSWIQMSVLEKFFIFQIVNNLLLLTAASTIFDKLTDIIDNPTSIVSYLGESIPVTATFFITYIMLQTLSVLPLSLLDIARMIMGVLQRKYVVKTERELEEIEQAPEWDYGAEYPNYLFIFVVSYTYSIISPIILPFSTAFFAFGFLVKRYQGLYSVQNKFESGGLFWPAAFNKMIACIFTAHVVLVGLLGLKQVPGPAALTVPLPILTLAFYKYCLMRFPDGLCVLPLELANACEEKRSDKVRVEGEGGRGGGDENARLGAGAGAGELQIKKKLSRAEEEAGKGAGAGAGAGSIAGDTGTHTRSASFTSTNELMGGGAGVGGRVSGGSGGLKPRDRGDDEEDSKESVNHIQLNLSEDVIPQVSNSPSPRSGSKNNLDDYRQTAMVAPPMISPPEVVHLASGGEIRGAAAGRREQSPERGGAGAESEPV